MSKRELTARQIIAQSLWETDRVEEQEGNRSLSHIPQLALSMEMNTAWYGTRADNIIAKLKEAGWDI